MQGSQVSKLHVYSKIKWFLWLHIPSTSSSTALISNISIFCRPYLWLVGCSVPDRYQCSNTMKEGQKYHSMIQLWLGTFVRRMLLGFSIFYWSQSQEMTTEYRVAWKFCGSFTLWIGHFLLFAVTNFCGSRWLEFNMVFFNFYFTVCWVKVHSTQLHI